METFFSFLEKRVDDCSSLLCVGLDPHPSDLPSASAQAALDFCLGLIHSTAPYAAAFKPNAAFFEIYGAEGWAVLKDVVAAVRDESQRFGSLIPVILDVKRGDIASSAECYARACFETIGAHAVTLNPYLGKDSIDPFLAHKEKGVFLLCKTSNPGAADLQDLPVAVGADRLPLHMVVAQLAQKWNTGNNLGLVVGATQPAVLRRVRAEAPELWILVPGVGVQGGDLGTALEAGLRADGQGMLVNISRSISRADDPRLEAARLRDEMAPAIGVWKEKRKTTITGRVPAASGSGSPASSLITAIANELLSTGCIKFGEFTLKSGVKSPIYIDLRQVISYPGLLKQVGELYLTMLEGLTFDRIAGLPYAAIPIATAISLQGGSPMIYPRKEVKEYGTRAEIEGEFRSGETVVVIDDLATTGGSKFEAIEKLTAAGLKVQDVVVLIDRQGGAKEVLEAAGYHLHAALTITDLLEIWEQGGKVSGEVIQATRTFLKSSR